MTQNLHVQSQGCTWHLGTSHKSSWSIHKQVVSSFKEEEQVAQSFFLSCMLPKSMWMVCICANWLLQLFNVPSMKNNLYSFKFSFPLALAKISKFSCTPPLARIKLLSSNWEISLEEHPRNAWVLELPMFDFYLSIMITSNYRTEGGWWFRIQCFV